jgi:peptide/nickel transport system substrate-binding protein
MFSACGERGATTNSSDETLTVLVTSVNWWMWNLASHHPVFMSLFQERNDEVEGLLVRSWEAHPDGRTWTYHLRTDVRWHDGAPVRAQDVKFTLDLLTHPELLHLPPGAASVEVADDSTLTMTFFRSGSDRLWRPFESELPVYPKHLLEALDPAEFFEWEFWQAPVGNGPYRFVRGVPFTMAELEANPDFALGSPLVGKVILKLDGFPRMDLLAGEVDIADVFTLEPAEAFAVEGEGGFKAHWMLGNWMYAIVWNHQHPILGDLRVLKALTLAINREELAAVLGYPASVPLIDVPATPRQRTRLDLPDPEEPDPDRARSLLEEAGWTDQDGDGIRERGGSRLQFTLLTRTESLAVLLQDQFRRVGVEMEISTMPGRDAELVQAGEFDASLAPGINTSVLSLRRVLVDRGTSMDSPDLERLLAAADTTVGPTALDNLYREMWTVIRRDLPATFLLPSLWVSVSREEVQGLASPQKAMASMHLHELWIEEGWEEGGTTEGAGGR